MLGHYNNPINKKTYEILNVYSKRINNNIWEYMISIKSKKNEKIKWKWINQNQIYRVDLLEKKLLNENSKIENILNSSNNEKKKNNNLLPNSKFIAHEDDIIYCLNVEKWPQEENINLDKTKFNFPIKKEYEILNSSNINPKDFFVKTSINSRELVINFDEIKKNSSYNLLNFIKNNIENY